jgi:hypothetical protein
MSKHLQIGLGSLRILDQRARQLGQPGLTLWTEAGEHALRAHRAEVLAGTAAVGLVRSDLAQVTRHATKAELFRALETAHRALGGALEHLTLCTLLACFLAAAVMGDDDDLARRPGRGVRGRRRDDVVELCDEGETGGFTA